VTARRLIVVVLALAIAAGGAYGLWYLFLKPAGPAAVALPEASAAPTDPDATSSTASASAGSTSGSLDGTWTVDGSVGSFSDFSGSFVGYRIQEELASIGGNEAVGRTPAVTGSLTIAGTAVTQVEVSADMSGLQSDDDRRDNQLRRQSIETDAFPTATFSLTSPIELGSIPAEGQVVEVEASGELTLHGVTRSVTVPLEARLSDGVITVAASIPIALADYDIEKPTSFMVLSVAEEATMELQLHFTRA
jgi:polyisoprenoid-binding protein YceI